MRSRFGKLPASCSNFSFERLNFDSTRESMFWGSVGGARVIGDLSTLVVVVGVAALGCARTPCTVPWVVFMVKTGLGRGVYSSFSSGSSVLLEILKGWTRRRYGVARYNLISMFKTAPCSISFQT
jgi:hypothetical protein